jgi:choline kinase
MSSDVTAILLVAGVGRRLGDCHALPKVLLTFDGKTLLERHIDALHANGVTDIVLTVGFDEERIRAAVADLGVQGVRFVGNDRFREGSMVSLAVQKTALCAGRTILLMDGDVLYGPQMIARLLAATGENVLLVDRAIEPGDEPVKICFAGQRIVDFRKKPVHPGDWHGESVGFFRFSPAMAAALSATCDAYLAKGVTALEYEEGIRDLILAHPDRFRAEDISDLPWTEIDFETDIVRARDAILPKLADALA